MHSTLFRFLCQFLIFSMKYQFFRISAVDPGDAQNELNEFFDSHRILGIEKQFVNDGSNSFWAICVSYLDDSSKSKKGKIDYREILNAEDFAIYAQLRDLRNSIAKRENVAAYQCFTNDQLANMVLNRVTSKAELEKIDGVGSARLEKYGDEFVEKLKQLLAPLV